MTDRTFRIALLVVLATVALAVMVLAVVLFTGRNKRTDVYYHRSVTSGLPYYKVNTNALRD